ncbi:uncharacterized protein LOC121405655 [Lytechinus variegatus]|uniref:uncharacterized protein LOC121405655 n=1 Tax=Lytechinus variegatus TaxID=7654 RepID=UPI001BB1865E|nr:uncharacterized protein LOC121405655 [Lytechinus variegatus]XP_041452484.1 uncharacterized protein LOC121405655 [Lytechinus variegatus]
MSRSNHEKASSKRSKMDRYTEDLKYSLRRRLSESVGKGTLRTDDILARSHRQIVSDFTDPRQWYYSATHDYIIALMRETQKQNGGSVWGSGSRRTERGSSRGHSSSTTMDGRQGRHKGSFIEIPTETSEDIQEIRGLAGKPPDIGIRDKQMQSDKRGEVEGDARSVQTPISKDTSAINNEDGKIALLDCFVPSRISPEGKSNITIKQEATVPLHVNTDQDISVQSRDYTGSDIHVSSHFEKSSYENHDIQAGVTSEMTTDMDRSRDPCEDKIRTEEYNVLAMEAYRASKQSHHSCTSSKKHKVSVAYGNPHNSYLTGKMESFIPVGKRSKRRPVLDTAVSLPQIGKTVQTDPDEEHQFQMTKLYKFRRGRVGSRKRRLCPLIGLEKASDKKGDLPYVEDWIRKLQINGKDLVTDKHLEPIERVDEAFPYMSQQRPQIPQSAYQEMELPSDFKPVTGFQQFQPLPSLYLYSLKQKSDLKVKLNYFDMPKLDKQKTDPGHQQKQSLKEELTQARTKVHVIENRLEELYRGETNLDKIVSRQQIKPLKKHNGRFIDITSGIASLVPDTNSSRERPAENENAGVPTSMDHASFQKVSDGTSEGQTKINTVSLSLSASELPQSRNADPSTSESRSVTQGDDFHLTSTSSWKQQKPVSPGRGNSGKVLEGKTLRVFGDRGMGSDHRQADQTDNSLMNCPDVAIASVQDCNASGSDIDPHTRDQLGIEAGDEELDEDKTGSMLSSVVLEVLNDLMDRLDVPDETDEHPSSTTDGDASEVTEEMTIKTTKDVSVSGESHSEIGEGSTQGQENIVVRLCSFCDEPHEIT